MPELEDRRISAAYKPNDRPESRSGHARLLEALAVAVLIIGTIQVGYPSWFVGALTALGTLALAVERWVLLRRALWVLMAASYLTLVSYITRIRGCSDGRAASSWPP
jgi:hypothetical protein